MKNYFKVLVLVVAVILISGCTSNKEIVKTCTSNSNDVTNGYKLQSDYKIYAKGDLVQKVETTETIISEDQDTLDYFVEYLDDTYTSTNEVYGGYTNNITKEDGKVISKTTIDYTKMDLDKYVEDNSAMKNYVNSNNELLLDGLIKVYESLGATCE